ncbi:hypothetical protein Q7P37_010522 [Cladosporium fusiforme]
MTSGHDPKDETKADVVLEEYATTTKDGVEDVETAKDGFGARKKVDPIEIRLVRKIDWYMMRGMKPVLWLMYFFNFLDRNAMINGKLNSLAEDVNLQGTQYNTCVSILFVGYLLGQVPSNMILNRVRPSWFMSGFMLAWSVVSLLTYMAHDYHTMLVCRLILGITEAPFYPGALYMISMFYTKKEMATRMAILYTGNMLASSFSGLIAAAVFQLDGRNGLAGWQWLFIIQGVFSIAVAFIAAFTLPDSPLKTRWLKPEERELAHRRIFDDTTNRRAEGSSVWKGLREAASDPKLIIFCIMDHCHLAANGFKNFLPSVVKTLGFDTTTTLALTCPPYLVAGGISIAVSWSSGRFNERTWHTTVSKLVACAGFAIAAATYNVAARYVAIMIFVGATYGVNNIVLAWAAASLGETDEKKAVAIAMTNTIGNLASVYTPYLWPDADSPGYLTAFLASIAFSVMVIVSAWTMKWILMRKNKKLVLENPDVRTLYVY